MGSGGLIVAESRNVNSMFPSHLEDGVAICPSTSTRQRRHAPTSLRPPDALPAGFIHAEFHHRRRMIGTRPPCSRESAPEPAGVLVLPFVYRVALLQSLHTDFVEFRIQGLGCDPRQG